MRRPRGRPPKSIADVATDIDGTTDDAAAIGDAGNSDCENSGVVGATVDPETVTAEPGSAEPEQPRRRGRPRGTGSTQKAKALPLNVNGLEKLLVGIHGGIALMTGRMEIALDTESKIFDGLTEAEFLAKSIKDVSAHYGTVLDQKTLDWMNLIQCLAIVYGGRLYAIRSTPRAPKPVRQPTPQETARTHRASPPGQMHVTPAPVNKFGDDDAGRVEIAGVGAIQLPDDHPLSPNFKPRWN
jgi:hypothetical protein